MEGSSLPWAERKRPEVKRTYQSKFKANLGASRGESLLSRAVWAFDALWAPAVPSVPLSKSRTSGGSASSNAKDSDDMLVSFGRLSLADSGKDASPSPDVTLSPQTVCDDIPSVSPGSSSSSKRSLRLSEPTRWTVPTPVLSRVFEFLDRTDVLHTVSLVATTWLSASRDALARRSLSSLVDTCDELVVVKPVAAVHRAYPWGCFLSDGAFKQVFKVWNAFCQRLEAVSVMNADSIIETGQASVLQQEVAMGCLASDCVKSQQCVNFVEIYSVFQGQGGPEVSVWGSPHNRAPNGTQPPKEFPKPAVKHKGRKGRQQLPARHLYIAMELCDGGSMEDALRVLEGDVVRWEAGLVAGMDPFAHCIVPFMAQMSAAMYTSARHLHMLHGDVKLLNFMMVRNPTGHIKYGTGGVFGSSKEFLCDMVVKLGDFGTASVLSKSTPQSITLSSFTTFENTPPEYLFGGDSVPKDYSADAWALGLCFLHLLTGCCPYEEVMEAVICPASLRKELAAVWSRPTFATLSQALEVDDTHILANTLYRMVVLLGLPTQEQLTDAGYARNAVWSVLVKALSQDSKRGKPTVLRQQYDKDCMQCSLAEGVHPLLVRARRRMAGIPHSESLLRSLLGFFPHQRLSLSRIPHHDMFLYV